MEDWFVPKNYDTALQLCGLFFCWGRNETIVNYCAE